MLTIKHDMPLYRFKIFLMVEAVASFAVGGIYTVLNYRWVFLEFKEQVPTTEDFMWTILELFYMTLLMFNTWLIVYVATYDENKNKDDRD